MNELVKTQESEDGRILVNGRDLHEFLEIETNYTTWFDRMKEYGFTMDLDFIPILEKSTGGRPKQDHAMTLEMAKEISMVQRTPKGKEARQYFLRIEKMWNSPEMVMQRALQFSQKQVEKLTLENQVMQPKALFADAVSASHTSILVGELAKLITQNGFRIGQNNLFAWLRHQGYLITKGESRNLPKQRYIEQGLMEIKERAIVDGNQNNRITRTTKITGKGQVYFVNKFLGKKEME